MKKAPIILTALIMLALVIIGFLSIWFYITKFGVGLWSAHEDWARMGSYFGGILGPIITSISLLFLAIQINLQVNERREGRREELSRQCESDILTFLPKLSEFLALQKNKVELSKCLFEDKRLREMGKDNEAKLHIRNYIKKELGISHIWIHMDSALRWLRDNNPSRFRRMRAYIISSCNIESLVLIDGIRARILGGISQDSLFAGEEL